MTFTEYVRQPLSPEAAAARALIDSGLVTPDHVEYETGEDGMIVAVRTTIDERHETVVRHLANA